MWPRIFDTLKIPGKMALAGILHPPLSRIECRPMAIFDCRLASNSSDTVHVSFVQVAMNSGDNQGPDRDVLRSIAKGPPSSAEKIMEAESAAADQHSAVLQS